MSEFSDIYSEADAIDFSDGVPDGKGFVSLHELIAKRREDDEPTEKSDLLAIKHNFYQLMRYRCRNAKDCLQWLDHNESELPLINRELLSATEVEWFPIPGMYGGFAYALLLRSGEPILITDSWVRIVGGSGEQHEITSNGITMTAKGFV